MEIYEPVLFTRLSESLVMEAKPSEVIKIVNYIGAEWGLNVKRNSDFKTALKIVLNSVKNN